LKKEKISIIIQRVINDMTYRTFDCCPNYKLTAAPTIVF
jgi:hypothetical protein